MKSQGACRLLLAMAGMVVADETRAGLGLGAGWFTAPTVSARAEGLRPSFAVVLDGWKEIGPISLGLEANNNFAFQSRNSSTGPVDKEFLWLTAGVAMVGKTIEIPDFPAKVRLAVGAGGVHVLNQLDRGVQSFRQESWGPEFHMVSLWERELGPRGLILVRLAGIYSSTFRSAIDGVALRSESDWSRVEFSMGWSWRS